MKLVELLLATAYTPGELAEVREGPAISAEVLRENKPAQFLILLTCTFSS